MELGFIRSQAKVNAHSQNEHSPSIWVMLSSIITFTLKVVVFAPSSAVRACDGRGNHIDVDVGSCRELRRTFILSSFTSAMHTLPPAATSMRTVASPAQTTMNQAEMCRRRRWAHRGRWRRQSQR